MQKQREAVLRSEDRLRSVEEKLFGAEDALAVAQVTQPVVVGSVLYIVTAQSSYNTIRL